MLGPLPVQQIFLSVIVLGVVLLVILALSRGARLLPGLRLTPPDTAAAPALRGSLALDARRRLHLVEVSGQQALVLTGGGTDVVVCLPHPTS